jgi:hypothetical protein
MNEWGMLSRVCANGEAAAMPTRVLVVQDPFGLAEKPLAQKADTHPTASGLSWNYVEI